MIFDYFFLMFYNRSLKSSLPEIPRHVASFLFGLFININLIEVSVFLAIFLGIPGILPYDNKTIAYLSTPVIAIIIFIIYNKRRIEAIKLKFSKDEFQPMRKKLNIVFTLYIVLTILIGPILAYCNPGNLPSIYY